MKKNLFMIAAVMVATALTVLWAGVYAKEKPCCPIRQKLNLTEDQQKQIEKLKLDLDKAVLPLETQLDVKESELKSLLIADNPDVTAINAKLDEIGATRTQIQKKRVAHELEVRKLLTPEQRVQFDKQMLQRLEMRKACGRLGMGKREPMMIRKHRGESIPCKDMEKEEKVELKKE